MRRVILHIGTHRTGTTSLQRALADHPDELARQGFRFPEGLVYPDKHVELWFASMRPGRLRDVARFLDWTLAKMNHPIRSCEDPSWFDVTRQHVRETAGDGLIFSCEGLTHLRYADEVERLREVLDEPEIDVVMVHRAPEDFLESYGWAMQIIGNRLSEDPDSVLYTEPDSWLVDYDARVALWEGALGAEHVHVVDFDEAVRERGSTLPAMLEAMGIDLGVDDVEAYKLNARYSGSWTPPSA